MAVSNISIHFSRMLWAAVSLLAAARIHRLIALTAGVVALTAAARAGSISTTVNTETLLRFDSVLEGQFSNGGYAFDIDSLPASPGEIYYYGNAGKLLFVVTTGSYGGYNDGNAGFYFKATSAGTYSFKLTYFSGITGDQLGSQVTVTITVTGGTTPPTVTTATQSNVTTTSATLGGNVTSDGGASVSERGIVWATTASPTTSNNKVSNGSGTGTFTGTVTGLTSGSTIHVRAYAINSAGTSYGSDISFSTPTPDTTKPTVASITRQTPSSSALTLGTATVTFRVTYSEPVTGVVAANFQLEAINGGTVTGTIGSISTITTSIYDVPVTITGGSGEFRLKVVN